MASPAVLEPVAERKERIKQAFTELENKRDLLTRCCTAQWTELDQYFVELEESVRAKIAEVEEKEKALEAKEMEIKERLNLREVSITTREEASLDRIQEQRDAAVAEIEVEKSKWAEEKETRLKMLESTRPAAAAAAAAATPDIPAPKPVVAVVADAANEAKEDSKSTTQSEVRVRMNLKNLCEGMDGERLKKYIVDHRKDTGAIRSELPSALEKAIDPVGLVLKSLEGCDLPEMNSKDSKAAANRRAWILILECLAQALADPALGADHPVVPPSAKASAREIAIRWHSKWESTSAPKESLGDHSLDTQAFLQLLATFGIASEFDQSELCKLITIVARRKQTPALCRSLGLTDKIPDIVETLSKDGKQIEALSLAHAFGTMDRLDPVAMLKSYAEDVQKNAQDSIKNAPNPAGAQNDANGRELVALKAGWTAVEEYGLDKEQFDSVQKRINTLEKLKADRKRAAITVKSQPKRPRGSTGGGLKSATSNAHLEKGGYYSQQQQKGGQFGGGAGVSSYGLPTQAVYERHPQAAYNPAFGVNTRSPSMVNSYFYTPESLGSNVYAQPPPAAGYTNPASYNNYRIGQAGYAPQNTYQGPLM